MTSQSPAALNLSIELNAAKKKIDKLKAELAALREGGEPVGSVEADYYEEWRVDWHGVTPPPGTELYAAPQPAQKGGEPVAWVVFGTNGQLTAEVLNHRAVEEGDLMYATPQPAIPEGWALPQINEDALERIEESMKYVAREQKGFGALEATIVLKLIALYRAMLAAQQKGR